MTFLISMLSLLTVTFISLITNVNCYQNFDLPRDPSKFLYTDLFLPDWAYSKEFIIGVTVFSMAICGAFLLLVS